MTRIDRSVLLGCLLVAGPMQAVRADLIVAVDAAPGTTARGIGGLFRQVLGVSWTMDRDYENVEIAAALACGGGPEHAQLYLTTRIGPGTTAQDVVATTDVLLQRWLPLRDAPNMTLFSGLSLSAGTYYLLVVSAFDQSQNRGWRGTSNAPTIASAPGVTVHSAVFAVGDGVDVSFIPDSTFAATSTSLQYSVTGTAVVPEPTSLLMMAIGATVALGSLRRRGRPSGPWL